MSVQNIEIKLCLSKPILNWVWVCLFYIICQNAVAQQTCYAIKDNGDINATLYSWNESGVLTTIGDLNDDFIETMTSNGVCNRVSTTSLGDFEEVNLSSGQFTYRLYKCLL